MYGVRDTSHISVSYIAALEAGHGLPGGPQCETKRSGTRCLADDVVVSAPWDLEGPDPGEIGKHTTEIRGDVLPRDSTSTKSVFRK